MIQEISLSQLELELKKRWSIPYKWGKKQNNIDDKITHFIYQNPFFDHTKKKIEHLETSLQNYAWNRWYNFWSSQAIEHIFCTHNDIKACTNKASHTRDFFWKNIPFDHKTTVFPKGFHHSIDDAKKHPHHLIEWLYKNQSQEQRKHWHNRFFIILFDAQHQQHWKLKAELQYCNSIITKYMQTFSLDQCISFSHNGEQRYAGIIWIEK